MMHATANVADFIIGPRTVTLCAVVALSNQVYVSRLRRLLRECAGHNIRWGQLAQGAQFWR